MHEQDVRPLTGNDNIDVDVIHADLPSLILHAIACRDKPLPDRPIGVTPPRQPGSSATGAPRPATPAARGGVCAGSAEQIISIVTIQTADRPATAPSPWDAGQRCPLHGLHQWDITRYGGC